MDAFKNANDAFRELFDSGQRMKLELEEATCQKEKAEQNLDELKKDFLYNLNLIQELETKVREYDTKNSKLMAELKLTQGQVSDAIIKCEKANDKSEKETVMRQNFERQLCEAHKLHDSLTIVNHAQHRTEMDQLEHTQETEIANLNEIIKRRDIELASSKQEMKMTYCRKRAHDKHQSNQQISNLKEEADTLKMKVRTNELDITHKNTFINDLEVQISSFENMINEKDSQLSSFQMIIQENQIIHQDYTAQVEKKFEDIQKHFDRSEFEYKNKISLLEKQVRIRRAQITQLKHETAEETKQMEHSKRNSEKLLHQEQVLHATLRDELKQTLEEHTQLYREQDEKYKTDRRRLLEFSERESKMMTQISTLKTVCDERASKISEQSKLRTEATDTFDREREYFTHTENNLRITVQRLKGAIKDMKQQVEEMTSDEAKKLEQRENSMMEKERDLAIAQANIEQEKKRINEGMGVKCDGRDEGAIVIQLKKALEEVHVLRTEKRYLLERCNKLSHDLRHSKSDPPPSNHPANNVTTESSLTDHRFDQVENLQYKLTKQQLGLVALDRKPSYRSSDYSDLNVAESEQDQMFLDSEVSSFPSIKNLDSDIESLPQIPKKVVTKKKKGSAVRPTNYNLLKNQIL